jgi:aspartyl-tRNA(Asn)/glutamyl-tRNA(Gln) amidotransferase subunit B
VEVKNMNSFRSVERAIAFEIERQAASLDAGELLTMETRGWDDGRQATYHMRPKEQSDDYRYFPEPDLPPLHVDATWLAAIRAALPELPAARRARYQESLGLSAYDATVIVNDPNMSAAFEGIVGVAPDLPVREVANLVTGEYGRHSREVAERGETGLVGLAESRSLAALVRAIVGGTLSRTNAREVLAIHLRTGRPTDEIIEREGFSQISDSAALEAAVDAALRANPAAVADYRAGKAQAVGFLVGQVMKATRGQANAALVQDALRRRLDGGAES